MLVNRAATPLDAQADLRLDVDLDRINQAMPQTVLAVGGEGGALTLYGRRDAKGQWWFSRETDETALADVTDEFAGDELISRTEEVADFEQALEWFMDRYPWTQLYPLAVHPIFGSKVWAAINVRQTSSSDPSHPERWHRLCFHPYIRDSPASD